MNRLRFLLPLVLCAIVVPAVVAADGPAGVNWTLTELNEKPFTATGGRGAPTLQFEAVKKQANGFSGVNRYFGSYEMDGENLKFGPLAGTRMAGSPEAMETEAAFLEALARVTRWQMAGNALVLLNGEKAVARFTRATAKK